VIEVAKRGGYDIIRPRHPEHPLRVNFAGVPVYDPDPRWVIPGRYVAFAEPQPTTVGSVVVGAIGAVLVGAVVPGAVGAVMAGAVGAMVDLAGAESDDGDVAVPSGAVVAAGGGNNWSGWPLESARAPVAPNPNPISRAAVARPQSEELLRQAVIRNGHFHMLRGGGQIDAAQHHGGAHDADDHESKEDGEESFHRLVTLRVTWSFK